MLKIGAFVVYTFNYFTDMHNSEDAFVVIKSCELCEKLRFYNMRSTCSCKHLVYF
jgi:hypothetical protein